MFLKNFNFPSVYCPKNGTEIVTFLKKCPIFDQCERDTKSSVRGRKTNRKNLMKCASAKGVGKSSQDKSFFTSSA
jgi:hypothetical protein